MAQTKSLALTACGPKFPFAVGHNGALSIAAYGRPPTVRPGDTVTALVVADSAGG